MEEIPTPTEKASAPDAGWAQHFLRGCEEAVERIPDRLAVEAERFRVVGALMQASGCAMPECGAAADVAERLVSGDVEADDALATVKSIEKRLPVMRAAAERKLEAARRTATRRTLRQHVASRPVRIAPRQRAHRRAARRLTRRTVASSGNDGSSSGSNPPSSRTAVARARSAGGAP